MLRSITLSAVCGLAALAHAQPTYEIGYSFNGGDEVVRIESQPFSIDVSSPLSPPVVQDLNVSFPLALAVRRGVVAIEAEIVSDPDDTRPFQSLARAAVSFDDFTFRSSGSDPIVVDLYVFTGQSTILWTDLPVGTVIESHYLIEVNGQIREGAIRLLINEPRGLPDRECTGFFRVGVGCGGPIWSADDLLVPVNEPVSVRFQLTRIVTTPAAQRVSMRWRDQGLAAGFHPSGWFVPDVFRVPDGIRVDSFQAGVRNNRFARCLPDLDDDGDLTLFDFLEFQNLFDGGDPAADFDGDGNLTIFDFLAFQNLFGVGCS